MIARWAGRYIGLPFTAGGRTRDEGVDCYGLVRLVLGEVYGAELPRYSLMWHGRDDWPRLTAALEAGARDWHRVPRERVRVGDVVLLAIAGKALHLGLVVDTRPLWMLHIGEGFNAALERLDGPLWRHRVTAFYRWVDVQEAL